MRLAAVAWRDSSSAAFVRDAQVAPIRALDSRAEAYDVSALIDRPLTDAEIDALDGSFLALEECRLLPPIVHPPKNVLCVGRNYVEHVREGAAADNREFVVPTDPIWFTKAHTALVGDREPIPFDAQYTEQLDFEGELVVVIGRSGRDIALDAALDHVYGYTILNDVTARDRQRRHGQWFMGKSCDGYAPCGPWIVTADELRDPHDLELMTHVDGELRQHGRTSDMIFDIPTLISGVSRCLTLEAGDMIATGTPSGVGWGEGRYLRPGNEVVVAIEGIGELHNAVAART